VAIPKRRFLPVLIALSLVACAGPPAPPPDPGVENLDLDIRLAAVPDGLLVADNQGTSLQLRPTGENVGGVLWFTVGPEQDGVNLVAAVKAHQEHIEGLPEGDYKGAQELQGPLGTAFYSRGRFPLSGRGGLGAQGRAAHRSTQLLGVRHQEFSVLNSQFSIFTHPQPALKRRQTCRSLVRMSVAASRLVSLLIVEPGAHAPG